METTDGALIYLSYIRTVDLGENGYEEFLQGKPPGEWHTDPQLTPLLHLSS